MFCHLILLCFFAFAILPGQGPASQPPAADTVYIYAGPGTSKKGLVQTSAAICPFLNSTYHIEYITPEQLLNDGWETQAALLVIPGGADIPYTKALNGTGNQKIRAYVENGGAFLGICAGSYYAGQFVDFAKGTSIVVQGARELAFFPGIVRGPMFGPYDYMSESSAKSCEIRWIDTLGFQKDTIFTVYYNGGGYFVDAATKNQVTVLATYDLNEEFAAIIECRVGRGKAILSGVHFEYDPNLLEADNAYLKQIIPALKTGNAQRLQLVKHILERLNLEFSCPMQQPLNTPLNER